MGMMSVFEREVRDMALRDAIFRIESLSGNEKYQQAWKRAADVIRGMIVKGTEKVPDKPEQISSTIDAR